MKNTKRNEDNRNYIYKVGLVSPRPQHKVILSWVKEGSNVIDLGCGDGTLLDILKKEKGCKVFGVEISKSGVASCKEKGVKALNIPIDQKLPFKDNQFDYAICNVTIQMVMYPEILLKEMKRISKCQIISFPNFGFIANRLELLFKGRMPQFGLFGYNWYSTGHIHQLSISDFTTLCKDFKMKIIDNHFFTPLKIGKFSLNPNLFAISVIYKLKV